MSFVLEHVLVIDETQRARCFFLLYKDGDSGTHDDDESQQQPPAVYIDYAMGIYGGFLVGFAYVKVRML